MTEERLPWFPCYPSKLLGAFSAMKPDEGYVYWIVCLRIYEIGGACPDSLDALVRRTGLNKRRVSDALDRLFRSGKLLREAAGIMNPFAAKVITEVESFREGKSRAGQKGARVRWEKDELKQHQTDGKANSLALADNGHLHLQLHIQKKEEAKKDSAPKRRDDWPSDFVEQFWNRYPSFRRTKKKTVASKLAGIRARGEVTWTRMMAGLDRYVATEPGEFACGPVVWLNGGCWDDEIQQRGQNGRVNNTRTYQTSRPSQTNADAILTGMARVAEKRRSGQSANGHRPNGSDEVPRRSDASAGPDANASTARGGRGPLLELDLVAEPDPAKRR